MSDTQWKINNVFLSNTDKPNEFHKKIKTTLDPLEILSMENTRIQDFPTFFISNGKVDSEYSDTIEGLDNITSVVNTLDPEKYNIKNNTEINIKDPSNNLGSFGKIKLTNKGFDIDISGTFDLFGGIAGKDKDYADFELENELKNNKIGFFGKINVGGCIGGDTKTKNKDVNVLDKKNTKVDNKDTTTFTGQMNASLRDISNNVSDNPVFQIVKTNFKYIQYPFIYYKWLRQKLGIRVCKGITKLQKVKDPSEREMRLVNEKIGSILTLLISVFITYNWFFLMFYEYDDERITTWNLTSSRFKKFSPLINFLFEFTLYPVDCLNWFMLYFLPKMMKRFLRSSDLIFLVMYVTVYKIVNSWGNSVIDLFYDSLKMLSNPQLKPWDPSLKHNYHPSSSYKGPVDSSGNITYSPTLRTFWFFHMMIFGAQIPSFIPSFYKTFYDPNEHETPEQKEERLRAIVDNIVSKGAEKHAEAGTIKGGAKPRFKNDQEIIKQIQKINQKIESMESDSKITQAAKALYKNDHKPELEELQSLLNRSGLTLKTLDAGEKDLNKINNILKSIDEKKDSITTEEELKKVESIETKLKQEQQKQQKQQLQKETADDKEKLKTLTKNLEKYKNDPNMLKITTEQIEKIKSKNNPVVAAPAPAPAPAPAAVVATPSDAATAATPAATAATPATTDATPAADSPAADSPAADSPAADSSASDSPASDSTDASGVETPATKGRFNFLSKACNPNLTTEEAVKSFMFKEDLKEWMANNNGQKVDKSWSEQWQQDWKNELTENKPKIEEFIKKCKETTPKTRGKIAALGTAAATMATSMAKEGASSAAMSFLSGATNKLTDIMRFAISHYFVTIGAITFAFYLLFYSLLGIIKFSNLGVIETIVEVDKFISRTSDDDYMTRCGIESRCTGTIWQWLYDTMMWLYHKAIQIMFKNLYIGSILAILIFAVKEYANKKTGITSSKQLKTALKIITVLTGIIVVIVYAFKVFFFDTIKEVENVKELGYQNSNRVNKTAYQSAPNNTVKKPAETQNKKEKVVEKTKEKAKEEATPVEKTPAEKTPVETTPAEKIPAEKIPAEKTPVEKTPVEKTPVKTTPDVTVAKEEAKEEEAKAEEAKEEEAKAEEAKEEAKAEEEAKNEANNIVKDMTKL